MYVTFIPLPFLMTIKYPPFLFTALYEREEPEQVIKQHWQLSRANIKKKSKMVSSFSKDILPKQRRRIE
jgi:DNA-binding transcriptional regulator PaaX